MRFLFLAAGAAWLFQVGAGFARADDPKPADARAAESMKKVIELENQCKQHVADHAENALKKDCRSALELAGFLDDETLKARALSVIGKVLEGSKHDDVRVTAIKAIADSGSEPLYRYVQPYLAQPEKRSVPALIMEAIECAGKLKAGSAVEPLLLLEQSSKVQTVNVAAMKALSNYGDVKPWRKRIVKDLVDDVRKDRRGITEESRKRYEALAGEMVKSCNKLTGRNCASPEDWFDLVEKYKTDLDALFDGK